MRSFTTTILNTKMESSFISNKKGKPLLVLKNNLYNIQRRTDRKGMRRCVDYKNSCLGRCHTLSTKPKDIEVVLLAIYLIFFSVACVYI